MIAKGLKADQVRYLSLPFNSNQKDIDAVLKSITESNTYNNNMRLNNNMNYTNNSSISKLNM